MSSKTEELVDQLSKLTVLEMADLKTALEDKWGVQAAAATAVVAAAPAEGGGEASAAAEATDFQVTLTDAGDKKIGVIKAIRGITTLGLKEAKELVESVPSEIAASAPKAEADEMKAKLEEAGGKVTLKAL